MILRCMACASTVSGDLLAETAHVQQVKRACCHDTLSRGSDFALRALCNGEGLDPAYASILAHPRLAYLKGLGFDVDFSPAADGTVSFRQLSHTSTSLHRKHRQITILIGQIVARQTQGEPVGMLYGQLDVDHDAWHCITRA